MSDEKRIDASGAPGALPSRLITLAVRGPESGPGRQVFKVHKSRVVIGSVISADVRLTGEGISPIHAVVELSSGDGEAVATIYDLASDSGVFVNGAKVVTRELKSGDELTIGRRRMKFLLEEVAKISPRDRIRESEGRKLFLDPEEDLAPLLLLEADSGDERPRREIFDYRPTSGRALEVVMSWRGTILGVEHFVRERAVIIGSDLAADFGIPPLLPEKRFPIAVRSSGGEFTLRLDPSMRGVIRREGQLQSLEQARASATKTAQPGVPFRKDDFAKISVGEIDFYFSFTAAPPRLRPARMLERDPLHTKILLSSLLLTALMMFGLFQARVPKNIEAEQLPERIATILYAPEKYSRPKPPPVPVEVRKPEPEKPVEPPPEPKVEPKPVQKLDLSQPKPIEPAKPIPKEMNTGAVSKPRLPAKPKPVAAKPAEKKSQGQAKAREGEGARAAGKEGTRGSAKAQRRDEPQNSAKRPGPQGGQGTGSGHSQVQADGNLDLLKGAGGKIENLLGNSAARLGKGGERLKGFGGFNTLGGGGQALSGDGKGGGGSAAQLGGLGEKGTGGGRVGTGLGAAGAGSGILGGKSRVAIRSGGPEEAVVMGAIDADAVEAALLAHKDEFRLCYEREINAENPNLSGRVSSSFVIGSSGRVAQAGVESTTLKNPNVERCILTVIKRIDFPIPRGGGIVQVTYPFKFNKI